MIRLFFLLAALSFANAQEQQLDIRIPVVDMNDYFLPEKRDAFLETLFSAMHNVGFFAVCNTGVDRKVIERAYDQAYLFFKQDSNFKSESFIKELKGQRGFVPGETAKGNAAKDCKEFYHIGREMSSEESGIAPNAWPNQKLFKEDMTSLYNELEKYASFLFEAMIEVMNRYAQSSLPLNFFSQMTHQGDSLLRALYYPALSQEKMDREPIYWAAEHTDIDLLTILPYATERGLQVEVDGQWLTVIVPEDAFLVNIGDMLENLSNGLFISARHRVKALEPDKDRFSMVFFIHPTDDTLLTPLDSCIQRTGGVQQYAPGTRNEFLWERLLELDIAPMLLEPYSKTGHTERQMQFGRESPQVVEMLIQNNLASQELLQALQEREFKADALKSAEL